MFLTCPKFHKSETKICVVEKDGREMKRAVRQSIHRQQVKRSASNQMTSNMERKEIELCDEA